MPRFFKATIGWTWRWQSSRDLRGCRE